MNIYGYVENDPINSLDYLGLSINDVNKIINKSKETIEKLTKAGKRTNFLNNLRSTFRRLFAEPYLGCGEQAVEVRGELETLKLDDEWRITKLFINTPLSIVPFGPHQFLIARSSNPSDPVIVIDPHKNVVQGYTTLQGTLFPWNKILNSSETHVIKPDGSIIVEEEVDF